MRISDWVSDLCSSDLQILAAGCVEIAKTGTTKREQAIFGPGLDLANGAVLGRHRAPGCRDIIRRSRGCRTFVGIPVRRLDLVLFVKLDLILARSEEHTSELQSLMRISYAVFCLKKKKKTKNITRHDSTVQHRQYISKHG